MGGGGALKERQADRQTVTEREGEGGRERERNREREGEMSLQPANKAVEHLISSFD